MDRENLMEANTDKTKYMAMYYGEWELIAPPIVMNGYEIECVSTSKLLGVILNDTLTWGDHVDYICQKATVTLYFLTLLKREGYSSPGIVEVYAAITKSMLQYGIWGFLKPRLGASNTFNNVHWTSPTLIWSTWMHYMKAT